MFGAGSNNEGERQRAVSIPQNFSWTGLERGGGGGGGGTRSSETTLGVSNKVDPSNVLHDLILWNILGFSLDDGDFANLTLVSKDWQAMCKVLEPVLILKLARLLNPGVTLKASHLSLFKEIFTQLKDVETCSLYRRDKGADAGTFPTLQPQFNMVLMNVAQNFCTQRASRGVDLSRELYVMSVDFLKEISEKAIDDMWSVMSQVHANSTAAELEEALKTIIKIFVHYDGLTTTIDEIAGYLNRYYCPHHSLRQLADSSRHDFVNALRLLLRVDSTASTVVDSASFRFVKQVAELAPQFSVTGRSLLLKAARATDSFSSVLQTNGDAPMVKLIRDVLVGNEPLYAVLNHARQEEEESRPANAIEENGRPIRFTLLGLNKKRAELSVPVTASIVRASGFLQKLHLRPGDSVRVKGDYPDPSAILEKVVAFYDENDVRPMPEIATPLPSGSMIVLVGPFYAGLADSCQMDVLFRLVDFANLMDFEGLLRLGCLAISFRVRNQSVEELRRLLNVEGEHEVDDDHAWLR